MSKVLNSVSKTLNEKLVQISLVGAILFYIVASPALFKWMKHQFEHVLKAVGVKTELSGNKLVLFHSLIFGLLLYASAKYLLDPVVKVVKGK